MIAWALAAASAVCTGYLAVQARRMWHGRLQEIAMAWFCVGVSLAVTSLAVFVAVACGGAA